MKNARWYAVCVLVLVLACAAQAADSKAKVSITVLDKSDKGIAGATVVAAASGQSPVSASTNSGGVAAVEVPVGCLVTYTVSASGYKSTSFSRVIASAATFAFGRVLLRDDSPSYIVEWRVGADSASESSSQVTATFIFRVRYYRDRSAVTDATLYVYTLDGKLQTSKKTDGNGYAPVTVLENVKYQVQVKSHKYRDYTTYLYPGSSATGRYVDILLRK